MIYAQIHLTLPAWVHETVDASLAYASDAEKVALAIELSRINTEAATGGPFGAVVFGPDDRIISVGVNRVLPQNTSLAHAETMAYMLAQQRLQTARLNERVGGTVTLATSSQPCCQCYGATIHACGRDPAALRAAVAAYADIRWTEAQPTLEDVFIDLMRTAPDNSVVPQ